MKPFTLFGSYLIALSLLSCGVAHAQVRGYGPVAGATAPFVATGSTTPRGAPDRAADMGINVLDYGVKGDGSTNDTTAFAAAASVAATANRQLYLPSGTFMLDDATLPTGPLTIVGSGEGVTVLKRLNNAAGSSIIKQTNGNGLTIRNLTVDGNKANNTTTGYSIVITGSYNTTIKDIEAKNAFGPGSAITFTSTTDDTNNTSTLVEHNYIHDNQGSAVYFKTHAHNWSVRNNDIEYNGATAVVAINYVFPPVADSFDNIEVNGNKLSHNTGAGLSLTSYITGGTSSNPVYGAFPTVNHGSVIGNTALYNTNYGLAVQGNDLIVSDNNASHNGGTGTTWAGILSGVSNSDVHDNIANYNEFYGIDSGGAINSRVHDNTTNFNGNPVANNGTGINCGACQHVDISNNKASSNGSLGTNGGIQIRVSLYDGTGQTGIGFSTPAQYITIKGNHVTAANIYQTGIAAIQDPQNMIIQDNFAEGFGDNNAYSFQTTNAVISGNKQDTWLYGHSLGGQSYFTIPDGVENIVISNALSNTVITFWPYFYTLYQNAVYKTLITAAGSNYTNNLTVTYSGGGCSTAPTGTPLTDNAGHVVGVIGGNPGVGCTSAPTVAFSDSTGSGAAATAYTNPVNTINGRHLRVLFGSGIVVSNNTTGMVLLLQGSTNYTVPAGKNVISNFDGWIGRWYETGRYTP